MLPTVLSNMIQQWAIDMGELESLPSLRSVRELIRKSDRSLFYVGVNSCNIPVSVLMEMHVRDTQNFDRIVLRPITFTPELIHSFDRLIIICILANWATGSVFWLFFIRNPSLYHGPYAPIFEESLLYRLFATVANSGSTD